jgi:hypothetical protein
MSIASTVKNTITKALQRFAVEGNIDDTKTFILLSCNSETDLQNNEFVYKLYYNQLEGDIYMSKFQRDITFNEITNVKIPMIDIFGIAAPFLRNALSKYTKELTIPISKAGLKFFIYKMKNGDQIKTSLAVNIMNDKTAVKSIDFVEMFNDL